MKRLLPFLLLGFLKATSGDETWSYPVQRGFRNWCSLENSSCCGDRQSPINLNSRYMARRTVDQMVFTDYDKTPTSMEIINNGHTVEATIEDENVHPRISGGGLNGEYIFEQLHFHWGRDTRDGGYSPGSEHLVDGTRYPMELHLVHYNSKFNSITEALESGESDALAVLGVLYAYSYSGRDDQGLYPIVKSLPSIKYADDKTELTPFPLKKLLPSSDSGFYRYMGSLTTPTCDEVVTWTVFADYVKISLRQLYEFTKVYYTKKDDPNPQRMINNFRLEQKLGNRRVWWFNDDDYWWF